MPHLQTKSDVFESGISDHQGIQVSFGRDKEKAPKLTVMKWNFTTHVRDFARAHKLDTDTLNNLSTEEIATEIINWLSDINIMCTNKLSLRAEHTTHGITRTCLR